METPRGSFPGHWVDSRKSVRRSFRDLVAVITPGGATAGWAKNISDTGIYFTTESDHLAANSAVELLIPAPRLPLRCTGRIVRIDRNGHQQIGVGLSFDKAPTSLVDRVRRSLS
jgi:hypothetical protein